MIKVIIGDIFESDAQTLVNTVNCVGIMGKGIAQEFKKRFPDMFDVYKRQCENKTLIPGKPSLYRDLFGKKFILNFPTKRHWKSTTLIKDIEDGLDYFVNHYKEWGVSSIAFPPLGCGNGGLQWSDVGPLMYEKLDNLEIPIEIYAPFGTPKDQLSIDFLKEKKALSKKSGAWIRGKLIPGEIAVLELIYRLQKEKYAKPIGRVMYQKACFILTESGVDTNFVFTKGDYGPFSEGVKATRTIFANNNLIREEKLGKMIKLTVSDQYEKIRPQYVDVLRKFEKEISRAVDLLSRIKDTEQGEEVATVIYATNALHNISRDIPKREDIVSYIFDWKKRWKDEKEKENSLNETIENLYMLDWINIKSTSEKLIVS